jgi:deoxyribonuclease-4
MIRIGTAGVPLGSPERDTESGIRFARKLGLDAFEIEFVRGVYLNSESAKKIGKAAEELDVSLSIHAPYYINLNSEEEEKIEASKRRILESARIGGILGARIVVFHPGFYGKSTKEDAFKAILDNIKEIRDRLDSGGNSILLGPETTGKVSQFGTLEELIGISKKTMGVMPVVDFGHMHARYNGGLKTRKDFERVFDTFLENIDRPMHIHMTGIRYSTKGELEHLAIDSKEPDYIHFAGILKERRMDATVISESPNIEADALKLKKMLS